MRTFILSFINYTKQTSRFYSRYHPYEIPEKLRSAFYCANASLVDTVNWYKHIALERIYSDLLNELKRINEKSTIQDHKKTLSHLIDANDSFKAVLELNYVVKLTNGSKQIIKGYRIQSLSLDSKLACSGGLKILPREEKNVLRGLALLTSQRNNLFRIPFTGSQGAILIEPSEFGREDLQKIVQEYVTELLKNNFCGRNIDIFEPDINTSFDQIDWIATTLGRDDAYIGSASVVGKPNSYINAIEGFYEIIGNGAVYLLELFLNDSQIQDKTGLEPGIKGKTFILQGLGKYGYHIAKKLEKDGAICVGIKEHDCFTYVFEGLNIEDAYSFKQKYGSLINYHEKTKPYDSDSIFTEESDMIILAAKQNTMLCHIAEKVQAKIIFEAAFAAITPTSHKILTGLNKLVIPDIMINGTFALVAYFEHLKNLEFTEKNKITGSYLKAIKDYYASVCPPLEDKLLSVEPTGRIIPYPNDVFPDNLTETELIKGVLEGVLKQSFKEMIETTRLYKLNFDFKTATHCKALLNYYKNIFDNKMY